MLSTIRRLLNANEEVPPSKVIFILPRHFCCIIIYYFKKKSRSVSPIFITVFNLITSYLTFFLECLVSVTIFFFHSGHIFLNIFFSTSQTWNRLIEKQKKNTISLHCTELLNLIKYTLYLSIPGSIPGLISNARIVFGTCWIYVHNIMKRHKLCVTTFLIKRDALYKINTYWNTKWRAIDDIGINFYIIRNIFFIGI